MSLVSLVGAQMVFGLVVEVVDVVVEGVKWQIQKLFET
jgi:hypothetical protein